MVEKKKGDDKGKKKSGITELEDVKGGVKKTGKKKAHPGCWCPGKGACNCFPCLSPGAYQGNVSGDSKNTHSSANIAVS